MWIRRQGWGLRTFEHWARNGWISLPKRLILLSSLCLDVGSLIVFSIFFNIYSMILSSWRLIFEIWSTQAVTTLRATGAVEEGAFLLQGVWLGGWALPRCDQSDPHLIPLDTKEPVTGIVSLSGPWQRWDDMGVSWGFHSRQGVSKMLGEWDIPEMDHWGYPNFHETTRFDLRMQCAGAERRKRHGRGRSKEGASWGEHWDTGNCKLIAK